MRPTTLRFFCEVDEADLDALFTDATVSRLVTLRAGVTVGLRDLSSTRARALRRLSDAGVPVGGWVLLPREQGYFATADNCALVAERCVEVRQWARTHGLSLEALGLDFEPDLRELDALMQRPAATLAKWWRRPRREVNGAQQKYAELVARLRADGLRVESYIFPLVLDDRVTGRARWQRFAGLVDVPVDREVVMLYSSLLGRLGPGVVASYARSGEPKAIAVGSTGGGVDPFPKLDFAALARDLRLAARACRDVTIFSLEGCVQQGMLERLLDFDWAAESVEPRGRLLLDLGRRLLR